jgi:hypothetical protein
VSSERTSLDEYFTVASLAEHCGKATKQVLSIPLRYSQRQIQLTQNPSNFHENKQRDNQKTIAGAKHF